MTSKIRNRKDLDEEILRLQRKVKQQEAAVVEQFHITYESLRPGNLVKEGFDQIMSTPGITDRLTKAVTGFGLGFITKKLLLGKSSTLMGKLLGTAVNLAVAKTAAGNTDKIKAYAAATFNNLFKKKTGGSNNHVPEVK